VKLYLLLSIDQQFLIEKLPHYRKINLAAQSKSMIIVTFGQECLITHKIIMFKNAQTFADCGEQEKSKCILPRLFLKALSSVHLPFLYKSCYFCHLLNS